ncbi:MAG: hypothetical protein FD156_197 [Nitrospirae bacterium]|nr:MAG: hypothetical protein FD156_197 [Nitrospirota bacterium]
MSDVKKIDGKLALIAIEMFKKNKTIQNEFGNVSEYYDALEKKVHSAKARQDASEDKTALHTKRQ